MPMGNAVRTAKKRGGGRRAGRCALAGPRGVGDRAVWSPDTRPTPIEIPILTAAQEHVTPTLLQVIAQHGCETRDESAAIRHEDVFAVAHDVEEGTEPGLQFGDGDRSRMTILVTFI